MVQLSHPYMTIGKTIALTRQTFVGKIMSLLLNMLSRLVIAFLPMGKCLLISWLQSPSAVILESKKMKSVTVSIVSPSICHEVMVLDAMILVFWMLSFKPAFRKLSKGALLEDLLGFLQPCCVLLTHTCNLVGRGEGWCPSWRTRVPPSPQGIPEAGRAGEGLGIRVSDRRGRA